MTDSMSKTFSHNSPVAVDLAAAKALDARIEALTQERKRITERLAEHGKGKHTVDNVGTFTVSESNTYPKEAMAALLLPGQVKRCSKAALDPGAVKTFYPNVYAAVKRTAGFKVTVG